MIQTLRILKYKNIDIAVMHDSGAIWYEIQDKWQTRYFDTEDHAKAFIDSQE